MADQRADDLTVGDLVLVNDPGLAMLREVMERPGETPKPNHHGVVAEVWPVTEGENEETMILINFDDGGAAPYPISEVERRG